MIIPLRAGCPTPRDRHAAPSRGLTLHTVKGDPSEREVRLFTGIVTCGDNLISRSWLTRPHG